MYPIDAGPCLPARNGSRGIARFEFLRHGPNPDRTRRGKSGPRSSSAEPPLTVQTECYGNIEKRCRHVLFSLPSRLFRNDDAFPIQPRTHKGRAQSAPYWLQQAPVVRFLGTPRQKGWCTPTVAWPFGGASRRRTNGPAGRVHRKMRPGSGLDRRRMRGRWAADKIAKLQCAWTWFGSRASTFRVIAQEPVLPVLIHESVSKVVVVRSE